MRLAARQSFDFLRNSMITKRYKEILPGDVESDIRIALGEPTTVNETLVPEGSGFGLQDAMKYKLQAGDPIKHLVYEAEETKFNFFLASVNGTWRLSMKAKYPSIIDER